MEILKLAQLYENSSSSKEKQNKLLEKMAIDYCVPDTFPGKQQKRQRYAGYTSLHFAVKKKDLDLTNELLNRGASLTKQGTEDGNSPLHIATNMIRRLSGQLQENKLTNTLLSNQVEINNTLNPKCKNGVSHLHIACIVNHARAVEFFAQAKETLDQSINYNSNWLPGYTPLHCAIQYSSIEAADILLRHGADVQVKNIEGMSCVDLLVERIMDMNDIITMGKRTLCTPYENEVKRLRSIIELLLKARANDEIFLDDTGLSALHVASILTDQSAVKDFLKKNADVNMQVKSDAKFWPGWTPAHFAACFNIGMMIFLMQSGADITIKNSKGETALDLCAKRFTPVDIELVLSTESQIKDIVFSDNCTKLSDLLLVMDDCEKFSNFLQNLKDINIIIPLSSPIWPGYNLLHLSMALYEKTKVLHERFDLPETKDVIKRYNCTEKEEALYNKKIGLCLEYGCSVSMKNANGQTPIHVAFDMSKKAVVKQMLSRSEDNALDQNGLSHLLIVCMLGQLDSVKRYVSGGADVNSRVRSSFKWRDGYTVDIRANSTPLHVAVQFGHEDIVEHLLERNADLYAEDSLGFTPIHLILSNSLYLYNLARILLGATPNLRDSVSKVGLSHLHVAAWANDRGAVDELLLNGAEVDRVIEANAEHSLFSDCWAGQTALGVAVESDSDRAVEALLKGGASEKCLSSIYPFQETMCLWLTEESTYIRMLNNGQCSVESMGMTPLHVACGYCDVEWAERLIRDGADVNARIHSDDRFRREIDYNGATPLFVLMRQVLDVAECTNNVSSFLNPREVFNLVELLVNSGADVTIEWRGQTPVLQVHGSSFYDDENICNTLLRVGDLMLKSQKFYNVNPSDDHGFSHFHLACLRNDVETAKKFLDYGADVNESIDPFASADAGFTPLHFAADRDSEEVVHLLLERGADVNAENTHGDRPLHVAMQRDFISLQLIENLICHGADIYAENMEDLTPLYCLFSTFNRSLTRENYFNTIDLLINHGCNLDQQDTKGRSLLHAAERFHNLEAIHALLQIGVDLNNHFLEEIFSRARSEIARTLAHHLWKIRLMELELNESHLRCLATFENQSAFLTSFEQLCQDELTKAKQTTICEGLTVRDFLSELGAVAQYPRMGYIQRNIVDKYFKNSVDVRCEFPEFCGLLAFQYRKALARMDLWQPAKEAIFLICQVELPDLCSEAILRYFTNKEMKRLVDITEEFIQ